MIAKRVMPPTYLLVSILAMIALDLILPGLTIIPPPWNLLGLLPLVAGVALNLAADRAFRLARTTVKPFAPSSALVTNGVYRISRNPMYLGFVLILVGLAALMAKLTPYAAVLAFAVWVDHAFITAEERMLSAQFGAEWEAYRRRVRRWL